mgnify:CR=1 FL=1
MRSRRHASRRLFAGSMPRPENEWWRQAVVYQIYPRSFADSDGDSLGDLAGIRSRVDYLVELGVDAVWLSPFYPSQLTDGGYDVDDHRAVDPRLGTLQDFDALVDALHSAGIRLIVDIVPNHTSVRHRFFTEALRAAPGSGARERYIFRDGPAPGLPPTDWLSDFGGSAWEQVADGQWYLHTFAVEQPDLNWAHPDVQEEFLTTLRFWADRGVDGFRIDVAHMLAKDLSEPLPSRDELALLPPGTHPFQDRDEVHAIYATWRDLFDAYDPPRMAVAEAWVPAERRVRYASAGGLGQAFNFDLLQAEWHADQFRDVIACNLRAAAQSGATSTWVLSNHDVVRHATRYGLPRTDDAEEWLRTNGNSPALNADLGLRRARAATLLLLALPGSAYLYQGEELGLHEVPDLPEVALQDPTFRRTAGARKGRDGCRVPLPWTSTGASFGFGPGPAHVPQPTWFAKHAVSRQSETRGSTLALYRAAITLRRQLQAGEALTWLPSPSRQVVAFRRANGWSSITNFGPTPIPLPAGEVLIASADLPAGNLLPGDTTAWVCTQPKACPQPSGQTKRTAVMHGTTPPSAPAVLAGHP